MTRDPQFFDETVDAVNETALLDVDTRTVLAAARLRMARVAGGCHEWGALQVHAVGSGDGWVL